MTELEQSVMPCLTRHLFEFKQGIPHRVRYDTTPSLRAIAWQSIFLYICILEINNSKYIMKNIVILFVFILGNPLVALASVYPTITEINTAIDSLMNRVNIDSLESKIRYLQNLGSRPRADTGHYAKGHLNNIAAKNWLHQQYENIENLDVYFHHFLPESQCDTIWTAIGFVSFDMAMNVVAIQIGTEFPDEYVIVCSHFDTGQYPPSLADSLLPGADDNASGTSGVLEIARVLSPHSFKRSIIYLNNNGEEMFLMGSALFAHWCKENNINILGVFNLDMIGYNFPMFDVETGEHIGFQPLKIFYNDRPLINKDFAKYFDEVSALYLPDIPALPNQSENIYHGELGIGDCAPFIVNDYPSMYMGDVLGLEQLIPLPC